MARQASQQRGGFYAIPPQAIQEIVAHRVMKPLPDDGKLTTTILDPCAGKGLAIKQWADILGVPMENVYAIELEDGRSAEIRETLPGANILSPCSAFGCSITPRSISFLYLNPPFDDAIGGGARTETQFLQYATSWLVPGGTLCFVCPEKVAGNMGIKNMLKGYYDTVDIIPFAEEYRHFNEVFVLARKTGESKHHLDVDWMDIRRVGMGYKYALPQVKRPDTFKQTMLTDTQVVKCLSDSPLRSLFTEPPKPVIARPPLELGIGHIALMLASGHLDGLVEPENEPPHVVRGTCRKSEYLAEVSETDDSIKEIYRERIEMVVRTVDATGAIKTFGSLPDPGVESILTEEIQDGE